VVVAALYHFARLEDHEALQRPLAELCCHQGVCGTLLLAREGVNGTIAGSRAAIDAVLAPSGDSRAFSWSTRKAAPQRCLSGA
jgi:UPF0176 protein